MSKPTLLVVAGCNGSGKSTYSKLLVSSTFTPFDYDSYFLTYYRALLDADIREVMAHNMARQEFENQINAAILKRQNFCYETNFNSTPLYWPEHFKHHGYEVNLIYLCLNSIEEAKKRVSIRVQNGGHFVAENEIEKRYYDGFSNLNDHFSFFNVVHLFDSSSYLMHPSHLVSLLNGEIAQTTNFPNYLKKMLPDIAAMSKK